VAGQVGGTSANDAKTRNRRTWLDIMYPDSARGSARELPRLAWQALSLSWAAGRGELATASILGLLVGTCVALQVLAVQAVLETVVNAGSSGSFASVLPALALLGGITVLINVAAALEAERNRLLSELVSRHALDRIVDVATRVDLLAFESPDFYDRLQRARAQGQIRALQMVNGLLGLGGAVVASVGIVLALVTFQPLLLPFAALGFVPFWVVSARNARDLYFVTFGMTPNERQRSYLVALLLEREPAKEVRAFQLASFLRDRHDRLFEERIHELRALARRRAWRSMLGSLSASLVMVLSVGVVAYLVSAGSMDVASAGAAVYGFFQLSTRLQAIQLSAASLYEAAIFIRDYSSFLSEQPIEARPKTPQRLPPSPGWLTVERVRFTYPGASMPALDNVSIEVAPGEVIALVGENGSGKTTLAKIVAGLFTPQDGAVRLDGIDTRCYDPDDLRRRVAVIFQDFGRYQLSAHENIGVGRHEWLKDTERIVHAAQRAEADEFLARLPEGYDTMLGREFEGGWDLSVGQWQRMALARAFFRDAPLVILDEPTAALDARAEGKIFERLRELLRGRSVILISHRFSSVRGADRIYVLEAGQVVERGSHAELVACGGLYSELFTLQASSYVEGAK